MKEWHRYMALAKKAHSEKSFAVSIELNNKALLLAHSAFSQTFCYQAQLSLERVMVSYFNIIDCYVALLDMKKADAIFSKAGSFIANAFLLCQVRRGEHKKANHQQKSALLNAEKQLHIERCHFKSQFGLNTTKKDIVCTASLVNMKQLNSLELKQILQ